MLFRILDFAFSILVSLGSGFANEAVSSKILPNGMTTATIEQQSLEEDLTSNLLEISFDVLNDIELDDLKSIVTNEFAQGLPSDTEFSTM
ncbi:hypothetical protein ACE1AT_17175 [Pelatocladus sp. BLCC-F211]|uniref:hypothetical protein n=1 Tax=Pelatocladus sp. BLCC-F211 TaxID=3342752 RepID=UPI0035B728E3